jgi:hypothetical protein
MRPITISAVSSAVLLALASAAVAGPPQALISKIISRPVNVERTYYRCDGQYGSIPDGTIAGPTGGYPYFGWYGYPYVPYRCMRLRGAHYYHHRQPK